MSDGGEIAEPGTLEARGQPVHTRVAEIELFAGEQGKLRVRGTIIDLRKHGFIPTGGRLQSSGVIHQMGIEAVVDSKSRVIESLESSQPVVAFEASKMTDGESCRDFADRLGGIVGATLDADFPRSLSACFGGPLGCSHLLTLAQFIGSAVPRALAWEQECLGPDADQRRVGESLFKRSILLDGLEIEGGPALDIVVQLNDVHSLPGAQVVTPLDRFLRQHEVRLLGRVNIENMQFVSMQGDERERSAENLSEARWQNLDSALAPLIDHSALRGLARTVMERYGGDFPATPLRDALLFVAPGIIQCLAVNAQRMVEAPRKSGQTPAIQQLGGMPDSCYIWREGGPGQRSRQLSTSTGAAQEPGRKS